MNAIVKIRDGEARASSQDVAVAFDKAHKDVLRAIDKLVEMAPEIDRRNFAPISAKDRYGRYQRAYEMDRDGFSLLAMGFTGVKALEWKLKFLDAFNRMEQALRNGLAANDDYALPAPMATAERRDAMRLAVSAVRQCNEISGSRAARNLWKDLGLPVPQDFDQMIGGPGGDEEREPGPLWMWTSECNVKPNVAVLHPMEWFEVEYETWCSRRGYRPMPIHQFRRGMRITFGKEERAGLLPLEIEKTFTGVFHQNG